jgi:predicted transcriptional regulator
MKTLTTNSSKEEEIQFLKEVASMCGSGSYLHSLLSSSLVSWTELQIRNDFSCDVFENWESAERQRDVNANSVKILTQKLADANALVESTKEEHQFYVGAAETTKAMLDTQLEAMTDQWHQALDEKHEFKVLAADRAEEIIRLKAALYDLEHPNK